MSPRSAADEDELAELQPVSEADSCELLARIDRSDEQLRAVLERVPLTESNRPLFEYVVSQQQVLSQTADIVDRYNRLAVLFKLRRARRTPLLLAEVTSRGGTTGFWNCVTLNRGAVDGVSPGLAVVSATGLIGVVENVSRYSCEVYLLTDSMVQVSCRGASSGSLGVLAGVVESDGEHTIMEMLLPQPHLQFTETGERSLQVRELLYTSGAGRLPGGILVGRVKSLTNDQGIACGATVGLATNLSRVRFCFVMLGR
jgi:cell shape-determining protein MreC